MELGLFTSTTLVNFMPTDLDRYYTPRSIAKSVISSSGVTDPQLCVDSTCGAGDLLAAAEEVFGNVKCVGVDRDKRAIAELRRRRPDWLLSAADMLKPRSYSKSHVISRVSGSDLLLLNPPFSHGDKKSIETRYEGLDLKTSIAMAHILTSFELFKPRQGAIIVVPESVLYSETDEVARSILELSYQTEVVSELQTATFKGARVHASIIRVTPKKNEQHSAFIPKFQAQGPSLALDVVRGGMPVHQFQENTQGYPFIHTTDLKAVTATGGVGGLDKTLSISRGNVDGWVLLIPRVGVPNQQLLVPIFLSTKAQLSDCVIAFKCASELIANSIAERIRSSWPSFIGLYKGTGARYVTVSRLKEWLCLQNIQCDVVKGRDKN